MRAIFQAVLTQIEVDPEYLVKQYEEGKLSIAFAVVVASLLALSED